MTFRHALALALVLLPATAVAQPSTKPVTLIVPFAPGASADGIGRIVASALSPKLGRPVVVENRAGAGGTLGLVAVTKAPPDGDLLTLAATGALVVNPHIPNGSPIDPLRDVAPVAKLIDIPIVLVADPKTGPEKTVKELIARSKENPKGVSYGSTGINSGQHLSMELLKAATGGNFVHVPYRGSAPAITDVLGGQIPVAIVDLTSAYPHIRSGTLIALGLADLQRSPLVPDVPTIAEAGVPGFGREPGFIGLFARAGTPAPLLKSVSAEIRGILADADVQAKVRQLAVQPGYLDEAAFARFLKDESAKWQQALSSMGLAK